MKNKNKLPLLTEPKNFKLKTKQEDTEENQELLLEINPDFSKKMLLES